jgi:hypothetical protein
VGRTLGHGGRRVNAAFEMPSEVGRAHRESFAAVGTPEARSRVRARVVNGTFA